MSSHREAPAISKDPVADNTDLYAFVDPVKKDLSGNPTHVTMLANFIPLEEPAGGPNFFLFGDDVLYEILIDNNGDGVEDVTYQFRFATTVVNPAAFLYNEGPISFGSDPASGGAMNYVNQNIRQTYSVTRVVGPRRTGAATLLASGLLTPPVRIGPRSTGPTQADYEALVAPAIQDIMGDRTVFAGQRGEGFYVDLGAVFDLATLRPFQSFDVLGSFGPSVGKDETKGFNVHTIALRVPMTDVTRDGMAVSGSLAPNAVIGVWSAASRRKGMVRDKNARVIQSGPFVQVSRLGEPLVNEVLIELGEKDFWNSQEPSGDVQFVDDYKNPRLQHLLPILYPTALPKLGTTFGPFPPPAGFTPPPRDDLFAILLGGIPFGILKDSSGTPLNFRTTIGTSGFDTPADLLRLNLGIAPSYAATTDGINPPTMTPGSPPGGDQRMGLLGGFLDGFPNGRRVFDNATAIELKAVAGATYPLVAPTYIPDAAAALLTDGSANDAPYLPTFPYLATPWEGYQHSHDPSP